MDSTHIASYIGSRSVAMASTSSFFKRVSKLQAGRKCPFVYNRKDMKVLLHRPSTQNTVLKRRRPSYRPHKIPRQVKLQNSHKKARKEDVDRCRKHRRRHTLLYIKHHFPSMSFCNNTNTSESKCTWLPTHIWHKKRMLVRKCWGYALPQYHRHRGMTLKMAKHLMRSKVAIHDMSYWRPITISGHKNNSAGIALINTILDTEHQIESNSLKIGREISCRLFVHGAFVGPSLLCSMNETTLWLWLHPAIYATIFKSIGLQMDSYKHVTVTEVESAPARIMVRGDDSMSLLQRIVDLCPYNGDDSDNMRNNTFFANLEHRSSRAVKKLWPVDSVLALTVQRDGPVDGSNHNQVNYNKRKGYSIVPKKTHLQYPDCHHLNDINTLKTTMCDSTELFSNGAANGRRQEANQQYLAPPQMLSLSEYRNAAPSDASFAHNSNKNEDMIPLLIIRKADSANEKMDVPAHIAKPLSRGEGYDIVLPLHHAARIWNRMCLQNAYAVGIEEIYFLNLVHGLTSFPQDCLDSNVSLRYWCGVMKGRHAMQHKLPWNKQNRRRQYWENTPLSLLRSICDIAGNNGVDEEEDPDDNDDDSEGNNQQESLFSYLCDDVSLRAFWSPTSQQNFSSTCLVSVLLIPLSRGVPYEGAIILSACREDIENVRFHSDNSNRIKLNEKIGKRQSQWKGISLESKQDRLEEVNRDKTGAQRRMLGVVTSGINRGPRGSGRSGKRGYKLQLPLRQAIASCRADLTREAALTQKQSHGNGKRGILVMFQNASGRYLRPAYLYPRSIVTELTVDCK